jgi:hypothetical protein
VNNYFSDDNARVAYDLNGSTLEWWLRSPGGRSRYAAGIGSTGIVYIYGSLVDSNYGVRPAMRITT